MKYVQDFLKLSAGFERLFFFILSCTVICHIISCLWIVFTDFDKTEEKLKEEKEAENYIRDGYSKAIYFTITTITTVGYGDILANTSIEKCFVMIIMISGVIGFSYATGTLSQIIQNYDSQNARYREQIDVLEKIRENYSVPQQVYARIKNSLSQGQNQDME